MRGGATATGSSAGGPGPADARDEAQDGDVLIRLESRSPDRYSVRQMPAKAQFTTVSREEAERLGRAYAAEQRVNVWYTDGDTWELVQRFTSEESRK